MKLATINKKIEKIETFKNIFFNFINKNESWDDITSNFQFYIIYNTNIRKFETNNLCILKYSIKQESYFPIHS